MMPRRFFSITLFICLCAASVVPAAETLLHEEKSSYTTILVTENQRGFRTLSFDRIGDLQSMVKVGEPEYLALEYTRAMLVGLAFVEPPRRILIVGLGGGSIPSFLQKYYPGAMIDVVDIDPAVVEVAKKYFGFQESATMRAHVQDGREFIEQCKEPYDLIFLDAYGSENIPYHLATREFLQAVRRALTPKGVVVGNIWGKGANVLHDAMVRTYTVVFDDLHIVDVQNCGNEILFALPYLSETTGESLAQQAGRISAEKMFHFDMAGIVRYGYRRAGAEEMRAPVLRDRQTTSQTP